MAQDQEEDIAIEVDDAMVNSIKHKLHALAAGELTENQPFLFRVPDHVRESNKNHYEPRMVSIGPYHRGSKHLRAMEEHKWQYLRDFLSRNPRIGLKRCIHEMKALEARARRCYFERVHLSSDEFVEMMLLDGCFIIEFAIKFTYGGGNVLSNVNWGLPHVRSDLLMFENQIPFFILQSLFDLFMGFDAKTTPVYPPSSSEEPRDSRDSEGKRPSLVELLGGYLMRHRTEKPVSLPSHEIHHLLHLYHRCFISTKEPSDPDHDKSLISPLPWKKPSMLLSSFLSYLQLTPEGSLPTRLPRTIPCATELQEAGVEFRKKKTTNFLDVTFENGVMEIPYLSIEDATKSRFMNLVAFEQCNRGGGEDFTSYATFMDCIIDTGKDVAVLEQCGIIENKLATDEDAALFFNQLSQCGYLDYNSHYLAKLFADVNKYCESDCHKWRARLMHDYFSNPWAILSVAAALVLLALTVAQTFLAVYDHFHPNKN